MATKKKAKKREGVTKTAPKKSLTKTFDTKPTKSKSKQPFNKRNFLILLGIAVVVGLLYYFKGLFVVALVNGQPITRLDLIQELEKRGGKQMLSSLITQTLIEQEAKKKNIDVSQKEIDEEIKKVEDNLKKQGQNLDSALAFQGLTRYDFIKQIRIQKLAEKMLSKDIKVSDKEISDYIKQNNAGVPKDMTPAEVTASAKQQLQQQKLGSKAQAWLADLQAKAKIQYFVSY